MPLLTIHHKTVYRYTHPVAFGEHRIMLRPRDGHDLRLLSSNLTIEPQPMQLRWIHDVFGNSVAIATFDERAQTLSFTSMATVEHNPAEEFALTADDPAYFYPFLYDDEEFPDLQQFITPQYGDPNGELSFWARGFTDADLQYPERHDPRHPRGLHLSQAARAGHPASARHAADGIGHLPRLCAVHDRGAAAARHRRALRLRLSLHSRRQRAWLCRRRLDACLGAGLSAERGLDRVRSDQRHHRHPRSHSRRGRARSAAGDPAARRLSRLGGCLCRHGGQHQRGFGRRRKAGGE